MNLDQVAAWRAVRDTGTTQAAAVRLGLSQPSVSRRVAQLEASLGLALFVRDRGVLRPTRESALLHDHLIALSNRGTGVARMAGEIRRGRGAVTLRIAVPGSLTQSVMPKVVVTFFERCPDARLELHTGPYDTIERMLRDDRAEIGFLRLPLQADALDVHPIMTVRTVCVMPQGHRLAESETVDLKALAAEPLILLGRRRAPRAALDHAFAAGGLRPRVRVEVHSVSAACGLVAAGLGVTLVNELMAIDFVGMGLVLRPLDVALHHQFAFATATELPPTKVGRIFIETATHHLRDRLSTETNFVTSE